MHFTKMMALGLSLVTAAVAAPATDVEAVEAVAEVELDKRAMHRLTVCDQPDYRGSCGPVDVTIGTGCTNFATWNNRIRSVHGWSGGASNCRFFEGKGCNKDWTYIYRGGNNIQSYLRGKIGSAQC